MMHFQHYETAGLSQHNSETVKKLWKKKWRISTEWSGLGDGVCALSSLCVDVKVYKTQARSLLTDLLQSSCLRLWIMFSLPFIDEFHPLNVLFMLSTFSSQFLKISHLKNWADLGCENVEQVIISQWRLFLILKIKTSLCCSTSPYVNEFFSSHVCVSTATCLHVFEK